MTDTGAAQRITAFLDAWGDESESTGWLVAYISADRDEGLTVTDLRAVLADNEVLCEQLAAVRLIAESIKRAAALGAQTEPGSEAWASIAYEATRLVCAL